MIWANFFCDDFPKKFIIFFALFIKNVCSFFKRVCIYRLKDVDKREFRSEEDKIEERKIIIHQDAAAGVDFDKIKISVKTGVKNHPKF